MNLSAVWFALLGVLVAGYLILDGFDLGVGILHVFVAKNDKERRMTLNSIGPVWDGNEVLLVLVTGVLFAGFPPAYAAVFSGFYGHMILLLLGLILRTISIEFRSQRASIAWRRSWDGVFAVTSFGIALLLGVIFGNILLGVPLDSSGYLRATFLQLLNPYALLVGV